MRPFTKTLIHVLTASIEITVKSEVGVLNVGNQMTSIKLANSRFRPCLYSNP